MQKLIIVGNVGKEAVVRQASNGQAIGFSVAVNESYKDKQGQRQEKTSWYKCTSWVALGASTKIADYLKPGQTVSIEGKPYADAYINNEGKAVAEQCIRVERLELVGSVKGQNGAAAQAEPTAEERSHRAQDDDNDLPF